MSAPDAADEVAAMTPPPPLTCTDYDYDAVRPCFFFSDGEQDDFYPRCEQQLLAAPCDDVWKKFELLQTTTPPSSSHTPPPDVPLSAATHLEAVSDLLDEDCGPSASVLQSFVVQDCMWSSSFSAATKLEEVVSEWLLSLRSRRDSASSCTSSSASSSDNCSTDGVTEGQVGVSQVGVSPVGAEIVHVTSADGAYPCAVTTSDTSGVRSPSTASDRDSDDEDDEDVDVETVNGQKASRPADSAPLPPTRPRADILQHNYAAQRPEAPPTVRPPRSEVACRKQSGSCWSSRSDSEGGGDRRRTHNVLERRRRSELKTSFSTLRDLIPALANQDKAARVAILKEAKEFIAKIRGEERQLRTTKDKLRKTSRELRRRLRRLQASS